MAKGPTPSPVRIRGKIYPSVKEAARALGVKPCTVYTALRFGREDFIGTGAKRPDNGNRSKFPGKPFKVGKLEFPSLKAASLALGRNEKYVHRVLREGGPRARQNLARQLMQYQAQQERRQWDEKEKATHVNS